jgi:hypothetical protein
MNPTSKVRTRLIVAFLAGVVITTSACTSSRSLPEKRGVEVRVDSDVVGVSRLQPGLTHTQFSADPDNEAAAVAASKALISGRSLYQNQHIMGWGALNPEPSPGIYQWDSLDSRIDLIRETSGIPVITLCCAPDWMKGGVRGKTDWSRINVAPMPDHYADFAALAGKVARRYPDVKYYQVWHGLKGFFDPELRRWDYESYTELYNLVYRELKAVNGQIAVGGPLVTMDSWSDARLMSKPSNLKGRWGVMDQRALDAIEYWLDHKEGADFITIDMSIANKDAASSIDPFDSTQKLNAVARWIRERTGLPLWAARWHPFPAIVDGWGSDEQSALIAKALVQMIKSNVEVALLWQPQAKGTQCLGCLWTDTRVVGGGQPTQSFTSIDSMSAHFSPGTPLVRTRTSSAAVTAIASTRTTLLINQRAEPQEVNVNGTAIQLAPYEVRIVDRASTHAEPTASD